MKTTRTPVLKKDQPDDTYKFQPLPEPTGAYPYHLSMPFGDEKMIFHMAGDTGNVRSTDFQQLVADAMSQQYQNEIDSNRPQFLYHLGDLVYNYGEAAHYARQFFKPFDNYPGPVFAIAGNHDSDVNPAAEIPYQSLDAFTAVFCDTAARPVPFGFSNRKSMVQPNIYWTLQTPLANIIGLHSNVPKYGVITDEQRNWFAQELKTANLDRPGKALIVCLHHAPYSADSNHGASLPMISFLESVFEETSVRPDIVFSGHVHNYQRFSKYYTDGLMVPYIVAGAGGFDELHPLAGPDDPRYSHDHVAFDGVQLEHSCDDQHGFLKISLEKKAEGLILNGEYYIVRPQATDAAGFSAQLDDSFKLVL